MSACLRARRLPTLTAIVAVALLAALWPLQAALASAGFTGGTYGYDISYPQKNGPYPTAPSAGGSYAFGAVGVTSGRPYTTNSYLGPQASYVTGKGQTLSLYMNLAAAIGHSASNGKQGHYGTCARTDKICLNENYGWNAASQAYTYAASKGASAQTWWLDIESANSWAANSAYNVASIQGAMAFFQSKSLTVGIYSTSSNWSSITGGYNLGGAPIWVTSQGLTGLNQAYTWCTSAHAFGNGTVTLVQYWNSALGYDEDYAC